MADAVGREYLVRDIPGATTPTSALRACRCSAARRRVRRAINAMPALARAPATQAAATASQPDHQPDIGILEARLQSLPESTGVLEPPLSAGENALELQWDIQVGRCGLSPLAPTIQVGCAYPSVWDGHQPSSRVPWAPRLVGGRRPSSAAWGWHEVAGVANRQSGGRSAHA